MTFTSGGRGQGSLRWIRVEELRWKEEQERMLCVSRAHGIRIRSRESRGPGMRPERPWVTPSRAEAEAEIWTFALDRMKTTGRSEPPNNVT